MTDRDKEFVIGLDAPHIEGQTDIFEALKDSPAEEVKAPAKAPTPPRKLTVKEVVAKRLREKGNT